jgi:hypothetical protein
MEDYISDMKVLTYTIQYQLETVVSSEMLYPVLIKIVLVVKLLIRTVGMREGSIGHISDETNRITTSIILVLAFCKV